MGEGRGRDRDEMKRRAGILSRQSFQRPEKPRALSGCEFHPLVHDVRMKKDETETEGRRKRAEKTNHVP